MTYHDVVPRPGGFVPSAPFGGREPTEVCMVCGCRLARLSPVEWVDAADNKASDQVRWHEHRPVCQVAASWRSRAERIERSHEFLGERGKLLVEERAAVLRMCADELERLS